jgi:hypothetical protein
MKVQSRARAPLRTINLLDEEDDDEVPEAPPKIFPMGRGDLSPKRAAREEELEKETCGSQKKKRRKPAIARRMLAFIKRRRPLWSVFNVLGLTMLRRIRWVLPLARMM